jgi:hypothetical protein
MEKQKQQSQIEERAWNVKWQVEQEWGEAVE